MACYDLAKVIEESIQVNNWTVEMFPQFQQSRSLGYLLDSIPQYDKCYATNNGVVAFVSEGKFQVTPATNGKLEALRNAGFCQKYFEVPFSNSSYPEAEGGRWRELLAQAKTAY